MSGELGIDINGVTPISGGSINRVYCLHGNTSKYLIKVNDKHAFPGMFKAEKDGLETIARTQTICVPGVILQDDFGDESFLVLEWIDHKRASSKGSALMGEQLAAMHRHTVASFGATGDNYMGSLPQSNRSHSTWPEFFIQERLKPMVELAIDKNLVNSKDADQFNKLYERLPGLFEEEPPALIHGDLWGGNYLIVADDKPYLIDPAISYGHRESDIAMTTLFGGFSDEFYEAYDHHFPLAKGWQQRLGLWNLYPLLVHLNLFGPGYLGQVRDCLKRFI
ncbi:MAG TPA: fructosamine kinase family protein [Mucilaginibacter sp.]|nr:fructosamine kinase family protein [Mucilaginibacter sp.]